MPRLNRPSRQAASRGLSRQRELIRRVRRLAYAADQVAAQFLDHLTAMSKDRGPGLNRLHGTLVLYRLPVVLHQVLRRELAELARWGHETAVEVLTDVVPPELIRRLLARRGILCESLLLERQTFDPFADEDDEDIDELERAFRALLLPVPERQTIDQIIFGTDWTSRIEGLSRLANPSLIATTVATGLAQGKTQQEVAQDLLPLVDNVRSSAKRIARTEGVRVGHEIQMAAWDQLGTLVAGYQIHWTPNPHTRYWHRDRDGAVYYKQPQPGQKGLQQMPRPPLEAPDPAERPPGTPVIAAN